MSCFTKAYIAAPVVGITQEQKDQINAVMSETHARLADDVYAPWEHKVPNEWNMPLEQWARCVFTMDVLALDECEWVIVCDYGRHASCGTAWEAGYAFAKGKSVIVVTMPGVKEVSLMVHNGCGQVIPFEDYISGIYVLENHYKDDSQLVQN